MSSILKCNVCNIVVDELLSYVQNKISVASKDTIVKLCLTSFTSDEIRSSKTLLFDALPDHKQKIKRKGEGKAERDLNDIIDVIRKVDSDVLPVFVARQLEKLPPLTLDHIDCTKLLKDLRRLQDEVNTVKSTYATIKDVETVKKEVQDMKVAPACLSLCNVNPRRGAWCMDSGPIGLSNLHNSTVNDISQSIINKSPPHINVNVSENLNLNDQYRSIVMEGSQSTAAIDKPSPPDVETSEMSQRTDQLTVPACEAPAPTTNAVIKTYDMNYEDPEWNKVTYRKKKSNRYKGYIGTASVVDCNFKAAERKTPIFITNVNKNANEAEIIKYINKRTNETVSLEKINIKREVDHKAYKFFVSETKISLFLDKSIWPKGIIFRKFVHFKYKKMDRSSSVDGIGTSLK